MSTKLDLRQTEYRGSIDQLSTTDPTEGDNLVQAINNQLRPLARLKANSSLIVNIESGDLLDSETDFRKHLGTIGSSVLSFSSGSATLPSLNNNNITVSPGSFTALLNIATDGFYSAILVLIDKNGEVKVKVGTEASTPALALDNLPRPDIETFVVGAIIAQNVSGNIQNIDQDQVLQFNQVLTLNSSISDVASAASLDSSNLDSEVIQSPIIKVTGVTQGDIHGLQAGVNGQYLLLYNATNQTQTVRHQSLTETTPANRIICSGDEDIDIEPGNSSILFYDEADSRWRLSVQGGGSGGASGIIYFKDTQAKNINKLDLYNDGGATPTDGIGGVVTTEVTKAINNSTPLIGTTSYRFSKDGSDRQGFGFSFTTDIALDAPVVSGEPITVQFRYRTSINYVSGQVRMFYYLVGPNQLFTLNGTSSLGVFGNDLNKEDGDRGQFTATISALAGTTAIRVIGHIAGTNAAAYDIDIDDIFVGLSATLTSPIVTNWTPYTPTILNLGTPGLGNNQGFWRRVGDNMEVRFRAIKDASAGTGLGVVTLSIPSGFTIDTTKLGNIIDNNMVGGFHRQSSPAVNQIMIANTTSVAFRKSDSAVFVGNEFPANEWFSGYFSIPIVQFANGTNVISSTQASFITQFAEVRKNAVQSIGTTSEDKITFSSIISNQFGIWDSVNNRFVIRKSGRYQISAYAGFEAVSNSGSTYIRFGRSGSQTIAIQSRPTPATSLINHFINISTTINLNVGDFIEVFAYNGDAVPRNLTSEARFVIQEVPDLTAVGISGAPLEVVSTTSAVFTPPTGTLFFYEMMGNSITLSPGVWRLSGAIAFTSSGGNPSYTYTAGGFFAANGTNADVTPAALTTIPGIGVLSGFFEVYQLNHVTAIARGETAQQIYDVIIRLTQSATIFLVPRATPTTASNSRIQTTIKAERIR